MPRFLNVAEYAFSRGEGVFLDANVWMAVFPADDSAPPNAYSLAFDRVLEAECKIHQDALIVSEVVNTYARIIWKKTHPDKKGGYRQYRGRPEFLPVAKRVADIARQILAHSQVFPAHDGLRARDLSALLDDYQNGGMDFNDQIFAKICQEKQLTFVTNDSDFARHPQQNLTILTANPILLK